MLPAETIIVHSSDETVCHIGASACATIEEHDLPIDRLRASMLATFTKSGLEE